MYFVEPSYEENIHGNKNEDFFCIIHICPTSLCIILTEWLTLLWRAIFNKGMQVESKSQMKFVFIA